MKPAGRKVRAFKGCFLVLFIGFVCLSYFELPSSAYAPLASAVSGFGNSVTAGLIATTSKATQATSSGPSIIFTCPDGRIGLHIVHTRFLIGQSSATPLFIASRLALLRTFLVPSLNAQTSQNFAFYASYDANLGNTASQAFKNTINGLHAAHIVALEQGVPEDGNWAALNFSSIAAKLQSVDPRVKDIDLFITSRIDADDAAHFDAISSTHEYACSGGANADTASRRDRVRVAYLQKGELWFPSEKDQYGTAGVWKTGKGTDDLYRVLAIMQSMILSGKKFISTCSGKLNVYGMRHYQPEDLETIKIDGCKFTFSARKNVLYWNPPEGHIGSLYVRTASSWTRDKGNLQYEKRPASMKNIEKSFGISPAALAATNLLFSGFQKEAPELVAAKGSVEIE
ncbi:hypothetical protein Ndes2526B_g06311 [Nannochloris sp. 'desiccata']|nr:hypothetical protein KSW81_008082 [Chlorella desiccata (nom. nud.)]KAH7619342.1 hypothetical protein NADE_006186 [Chlorella desiccata (nom. nud.)]